MDMMKTDNDCFIQALTEWRERMTPIDLTPVEEISGHEFMKICERAQALKMETRRAGVIHL
jgi:sulfur relay (sulfurtransferase) DsrC/TusE family protein